MRILPGFYNHLSFVCCYWMMSSGASSYGSRLSVLSALEVYEFQQQQGADHLKAAVWNLSKARLRKQGHGGALTLDGSSGLFSASDVREEIRANAVVLTTGRNSGSNVTQDAEPGLVEENNDTKKDNCTVDAKNDTSSAYSFSLVNALEQKQLEKENSRKGSGAETTKITNANTTLGLRQRRKNTNSSVSKVEDKTDSKSPWTTTTTEQEGDDPRTAEFLSEEDKLLAIDPISLFGGILIPNELKIAQARAKQALDSYIKAANLVQTMTQQMNKKRK